MVTLKMFPGDKTPGILNPVEKEQAIKVIYLMLVCCRGHSFYPGLYRGAVSIHCAYVYYAVAMNYAAQIGYAKAAFVIFKHVLACRSEHRVYQYSQRNIGTVGVAWVVAHLNGANTKRLMNLVGREPGTFGCAHGFDQIINELLHFGVCKQVRR
jgi:hypothetical protein